MSDGCMSANPSECRSSKAACSQGTRFARACCDPCRSRSRSSRTHRPLLRLVLSACRVEATRYHAFASSSSWARRRTGTMIGESHTNHTHPVRLQGAEGRAARSAGTAQLETVGTIDRLTLWTLPFHLLFPHLLPSPFDRGDGRGEGGLPPPPFASLSIERMLLLLGYRLYHAYASDRA